MEIKHHHFEQLDSTQTYLIDLLNQSDEQMHAVLITASDQAAGIGRRGQSWSHKPDSLAMSFTYPAHPIVTLSTLDIAIAIAEYFKRDRQIDLTIKWPNDLFYNGFKVGGIIANTHQANLLIVGLGINLARSTHSFEYHCITYFDDSKDLASSLYHFLLARPQLSISELHEKFHNYCHHLNQSCQFEGNNFVFKTIGTEGQAILHDESGKTKEVYSGSLLFN